jgi:crotonobetainyl-CoA:carnitine CoA-transferase CaiB-like acyl-CoA transferase
MQNMHTRPLSGYRVVDFGQYIAGPAVAMMLADQGAQVIHIDPPQGPRWDNPADAILNRGKQRISLDLKSTEDLAKAKALIASADVVIENFRPGVMDKLGLGAKQLCEANPQLVYCSLPGFSKQDQQMCETPAWEGIIAASIGQYTDMGLNRILMGINPSFSPLPLASAYASVLASTSVMLALYSRVKTGRGEIIEVPISAALMEGLAYNSMRIHDLPDRYKSPREIEIEKRREHNEPLNLEYSDLQEFLDPFYRTYLCADHRPFYTVCSSHTRHPIACLKVLGLWDEIKALGIPTHSAYLDQSQWPKGAKCTVVSYPLSKDWAQLVSSKMKAVFASKTAYQWQQIFGDAGVPGCAHQLTKEWINSEHALQSANILQVNDPKYGLMKQFGNICWLDGDVKVTEKLAAAAAGQDNAKLDDIIKHWQTTARTGLPSKASHLSNSANSSTSKQQESWLKDLKILDLTNVIAGPTIAGTLARFGAQVISIDPPTPALDPWNSTVFGIQANQGKKSLLLDLKTTDGQEVLKRLLTDIDIVTVNASDAQLQRLGLSIEQLHAINPELILCQFDAYGGPKVGPRSNHLGYDDLVQATTGIMSRFGGSMDTPEEHAHFGTIDVLGGYCGAQAIALALVKRANGFGGSLARSSLIAAGQLIQAPFMYDYTNREAFNEPSGRYIKGKDALYRCYQANNGWFFLALDKARQLDDFTKLVALKLDLSDNQQSEKQLENLFATQSLAHWQELFESKDIGCQPLATMDQLRVQNLMDADKADLANQNSVAFIRHHNHPCGYTVDLIAPNAIRLQYAAVELPCPMVKYGENSQEILEQLQFTAQEIDAMLQSGVTATSWSKHYLPK